MEKTKRKEEGFKASLSPVQPAQTKTKNKKKRTLHPECGMPVLAGAKNNAMERPKQDSGETKKKKKAVCTIDEHAERKPSESKKQKVKHIDVEPGSVQCGKAAWKIAHDKVKGRILLATRDIDIGEVILEEEALVCASSYEHRCLECHEPHESTTCVNVQKSFPPALVKRLSKIESEMVQIQAMELELDRARTLIKILNLCRTDPQILEETQKCTAVNLEDCMGVICEMRASKVMRHAIPDGISDDDAARMLAVLNTNSHELAEWGGSGLYPLACIMEHDCRPNCSFSTHGTRLWVTAMEKVREGDALSIDYGESVFEPTARRIEHLEEAYGFTCTCESCTVRPDRCRAFTCPQKGCPGPLCPIGKGEKAEDWKCLRCQGTLNKAQRKARIDAEEAAPEAELDTMDDVDEILKEGLLDETHHEVFHALLEIGEEAASSSLEVLSGRAEAVWRRVVASADKVLQKGHSKKAIFYDNLAQVLVARGDIAGAKEAFAVAYEVMKRSSGKDTPPTMAAKKLVDKTPKTTAELEKTYADVQENQLLSHKRTGIDGLAILSKAK